MLQFLLVIHEETNGNINRNSGDTEISTVEGFKHPCPTHHPRCDDSGIMFGINEAMRILQT